jgi:Phosphotransferase enzyme family
MAGVAEVEIVVAHSERATLRVGDVFLKIDADQRNTDVEVEWLVTSGVLPPAVVTRNRQVAEAALRPWTPVFTHGDLQITHVFVDGDEITGVIDWSEASQGDALYDRAILTLGHEEHLGDVLAGYGADVDLDVIRGWWSLRSLQAARWLIEHGFDPNSPGAEFDVLRSRMSGVGPAR